MDLKSNLVCLLVCLIFFSIRILARNSGKEFQKHSQVLVLGAGMSGITAAKTLHENGIEDFIILEGSERIGGRMRCTEFAGTVIELGANWVQGIKNNPIWDLAKKYNLQGGFTMANPTVGEYIVRNETGHDVTSMDNHEAFRDALIKLKNIIEERRKAGKGDIDARTGIRLAGWQPQNPAQSTVEYFKYDFDDCLPPLYISCQVKKLTNGSIESNNGKQYFVFDPRCYSHIVDEMARSFLNPPTDSHPRLLLNQVVHTIQWDTHGVSVTTQTGDVFTADYLLVTFSIGVLKSNAVSFKPQLPAQIIEPIFKQAMVDYIKIFLKFPSRFWDKKQYIFYASERRGYYPIWQDIGVDAGLPEGLNLLMITVTGEEATRIQFQSDAETKAEIMEVLFNVYGSNIPNATDILYKRWAHDPLFYGTYSNIPIGMTHEDYIALQTNVSRMYFAGEATSELYTGFVHGAYFSGLERAEKIIHDIKENT